ncbi:hypothetical protein MNBD_PLANCTO03-1541 [hydrothermal vent metagenome]|uniref:Asp/Glu-ADT subunit C n=1 Tax=hydrothermal vent metagenome TaxID=652676 RepID=A0A3B1DVZ1_9ZZZZ
MGFDGDSAFLLYYTLCMAQPDLTSADIRTIARLSRLAIEETEIEGYQAELGAVLGFVHRLGELDLAGVEPLTHIGGGGERDSSIPNRLAADEPGPVLANDTVMGLAPGAKPPFFRVPKVLNEDKGESGGA